MPVFSAILTFPSITAHKSKLKTLGIIILTRGTFVNLSFASRFIGQQKKNRSEVSIITTERLIFSVSIRTLCFHYRTIWGIFKYCTECRCNMFILTAGWNCSAGMGHCKYDKAKIFLFYQRIPKQKFQIFILKIWMVPWKQSWWASLACHKSWIQGTITATSEQQVLPFNVILDYWTLFFSYDQQNKV